ncbi:hypothetical protein [Paraburkholderia dilworthii]|uniref:hypothetical protein n=1 Tax=Paraburkholderia dilworthii TaxID=948106 RepID=UPI00048112E1|nr:hypothetical protein [Paraburkholderia dilworthii]
MTIDIDALETLAKAGHWAKEYGPSHTVEVLLELIAEVRALREVNTILRNHLLNMNFHANAIHMNVQSGLNYAKAARGAA